jgi:hypothetical protein
MAEGADTCYLNMDNSSGGSRRFQPRSLTGIRQAGECEIEVEWKKGRHEKGTD